MSQGTPGPSPAAAPTTPAAAPAEVEAPAAPPTWEEAKKAALEPAAEPKAAAKVGTKKADAKTVANGQAPAAEPTAPDEAKPVPSREWASLHHKQGKLKEQQAAFEQKYEAGKKELAALEARSAELETRSKQLEQLEMDPKAFISFFAKKLGCSEAKVINSLNTFFLEGRSPTDLELDKVKADLKRRDEKDAEDKKAAVERQKQEAEAAKRGKVEGYQRQIVAYVTEHTDDYVHLPAYPAEAVAATAWSRIQEHWQRTGQNIPLDKMLSTLEAEEEKKYAARHERWEKRKQGDGAQPLNPERGGAGKAADHGGQQRPSTLNHQLATQRGTKARELSDKDAWEESKRNSGIR